MGITFTDREIKQIENVNKILKERENHGQGHYNDRGSRWGKADKKIIGADETEMNLRVI